MSHVSKFTDRITKAKLAPKDEIAVLNAKAEAAAFPEREAQKIKEIEGKIAAEKATRYPSAEYIARCEKKILEIKQTVALINMQKIKH